MKQTTVQYIQAAITVALGFVGMFLPLKYNPFQFKKYGTGKLFGRIISERIQQKIPKIIGALLIYTGITVAILTTILGEMPW